ncbi:protoporphyrinogen oxidase [Haladaptatus sp. NG-SE-30]
MTIGIVGGGLGGLTLHHYLQQAGVDSVVFEGSDEPGGVIRSRRVEGRVLDFGPQRTRTTPSITELVSDLGLEGSVRRAAEVPLYIYHHEKLRLVPQSVRDALTTDLISLPAKLRVLLEPFTDGPRADETVEAYLTRAFGSEVAEYYFGPLYGGLYGSHPEEMYMRYTLARALKNAGIDGSVLKFVLRSVLRGRDPPDVISFDDGLQTFPRALFDAHADSISLETPVEEVRQDGSGYELETSAGTQFVDELVFTTPADVTADLVKPFAAETGDALRRLTYNPMAIVHLHSDCKLDSAGYQIQYDESFRTLGVTANDSLLNRDGVYTCYLGGAKNPSLVDWSDDRLGRVAAEEFEAVTGDSARPLSVYRLQRGMPAYDRSWTAIDDIALPESAHLCTNYTSRAGIPGRVRNARQLAERLSERHG